MQGEVVENTWRVCGQTRGNCGRVHVVQSAWVIWGPKRKLNPPDQGTDQLAPKGPPPARYGFCGVCASPTRSGIVTSTTTRCRGNNRTARAARAAHAAHPRRHDFPSPSVKLLAPARRKSRALSPPRKKEKGEWSPRKDSVPLGTRL